MSYKIEYISTFHFDVQSVADFLAEYPSKAARIFAKADRSISNLKEMPEMYPVYQDVPSFRFIVVEDYLVFYKLIQESRIVEVHRLIYGRMDIAEHMQE
ncbi:MAG: type II toxin-antitoxin system RelE/ParE family toxin [Oscillospiraceae bacterium]|nr:type II toxin-antitoxin system RelE/ParE family toxin [Oscillospiraceae bacterium]